MQKPLHIVIIGLLAVTDGHKETHEPTFRESPIEQLITLPPNRELFHLKSLCNIKPTSALISKKLDNFVYECMYAKPALLPIDGVSANYTDVVRNFHKR